MSVSSAHSSLVRASTACLEQLESRRLLSATLDASTLLIHGTADDDIISIRLNDGIYLVRINGAQSQFEAAGVTHMQITTGDGHDRVVADKTVTAALAIDAGGGDDYVQGGGGNDEIFGGAGNDFLLGGDGDDYISGGDGNDDVRGEFGNDTLSGDAGDDSLWGHEGSDVLGGGEGADMLRGGAGGDVLKGHNGDDSLLGHEGPDTLFGGGGSDLLHGSEGSDLTKGHDGRDVLVNPDADDRIKGAPLLSPREDATEVDWPIRNRERLPANGPAPGGRPSDWLADLLANARDGGVKRHHDEHAGVFISPASNHPTHEKHVAHDSDELEKDSRGRKDVPPGQAKKPEPQVPEKSEKDHPKGKHPSSDGVAHGQNERRAN